MSTVRFFISYSHEDAVWFEGGYLMPQLIREIESRGGEVWYDNRRLHGASPYRQEIERAIEAAHVAILLVSRDFLISEFIRDFELPLVQNRVDGDPAFRVVCINVGHIGRLPMPFKEQFLHLPTEQEPLIEIHENRAKWSRARAEIHDSVLLTLEEIQQAWAQPAETSPKVTKPEEPVPPARPAKSAKPKAPPGAATTSNPPTRVEAGPERAPGKAAQAEPASAGSPAGTADTVEIAPGITLDLVWCPPGTFLMGSPDADDTARNNEKPQHQVTLTKGFWMGKYPVTQEQWEAVMGNTPSKYRGPKNPVECVSWNDCQEFIKTLSDKTGETFRLPTEAEWEYACRAGSRTAYCFGDAPRGLDAYAWHSGNSSRKPHPVGKKRANAWGLHDMHGNIFEWCEDRLGSNYYASSPPEDPTGPSSGAYRVLRGGSWYFSPVSCRAAFRDLDTPDYAPSSYGFRVVRTP